MKAIILEALGFNNMGNLFIGRVAAIVVRSASPTG